jgi:hypothetical protein
MDILTHDTLQKGVKLYVEDVHKTKAHYILRGWIGTSFGEVSGFSINEDKVTVKFLGIREDVQEFYNNSLSNQNMQFKMHIPLKDMDSILSVDMLDGPSIIIGSISKWIVCYSGFANEDKGIIVVDNFYKDPDLVRSWAMNDLEYSPSNYHKGERATSRFILDGTKEKLEEIIGKPIYNWNHDQYANGIFQFCTADQPIVYHVDNQTYAGMVYLTPEAPARTGTAFYRSKVTKDYKFDDAKRSTQAYVDAFKGNSKEMNFYDGTNFEKIDEVGNIYNRLVLFDAKNIHAATEYFGDAIDNARFFHMFFFDV